MYVRTNVKFCSGTKLTSLTSLASHPLTACPLTSSSCIASNYRMYELTNGWANDLKGVNLMMGDRCEKAYLVIGVRVLWSLLLCA